jgi:hypothetical protein
MKRAGAVGVVLIAAFVTTGGNAWAGSAVKLCVPKKEGAGLVTPRHGKCKRGYKLTSLGAEGNAGAEGKQGAAGKPGTEGKQGLEGNAGFTTEQAEELKALLPHMRFVGSGVAGKPTVQFSGVNVQVVNGEGKTASTNGEGNLVIGYDQNPPKRKQTGSHDLVLGEDQEFTSYGGILAGFENTASAPYASVTGGERNTASGPVSSVTGGILNTATEFDSAISGGSLNVASGGISSVAGGVSNKAGGENASVSGGSENVAPGSAASVSGGHRNGAVGEMSSVSGGERNGAFGPGASISGGRSNGVESRLGWIGGGLGNTAGNNGKPGEEGLYAAVFGGKENKTAKDYEAIP